MKYFLLYGFLYSCYYQYNFYKRLNKFNNEYIEKMNKNKY